MTRWLDPMEKWDYRRNAHKKVAILGSSTSRDWLDPGYLQRLLNLKRGSVLDAHINGCRPGCTWSEVRLMLQRYRIKRCRLRGNADSEPESAMRASRRAPIRQGLLRNQSIPNVRGWAFKTNFTASNAHPDNRYPGTLQPLRTG